MNIVANTPDPVSDEPQIGWRQSVDRNRIAGALDVASSAVESAMRVIAEADHIPVELQVMAAGHVAKAMDCVADAGREMRRSA